MDVETLAEAWGRRIASETAQVAEQAEETRRRVGVAAQALLEELGAREVWLFGSLAGTPRHPDFDVDLAVGGLHPGRYFEALDRVSTLVGRPVDLVALETAPPALVERIHERGVRIVSAGTSGSS